MSRDEAYLLDILLAARDAVSFVEGLDWEQFQESKLHQDAVVRALEVVGEAAQRVSDATQSKTPGVPWREMAGMRNRLIHEYFRVDLEKVWDTVLNSLPELIKTIEPLVPPE
jgi:uncharacterized protein with HEPN domain